MLYKKKPNFRSTQTSGWKNSVFSARWRTQQRQYVGIFCKRE